MKRPNILIIQSDQHRWDAIGANGNPEVKTPNLDRLTSGGVGFLNHYVQHPVCMPSRASFLTGQYPSKSGCLQNGIPVPQDAVTLPRILRNYGYVSGNVGKLHFLPHANRDHRQIHPDYGFDHMEISDEPGCYEDVYRAWVRRQAPDQLPYISRVFPPAAAAFREQVGPLENFAHPQREEPGYGIEYPVRKDVTQAAFVVEQTMEFVRQHQQGPFMCIAGIYAPHSPCLAPQEFRDLYDPTKLSLPDYPPETESRRAGTIYSDVELRRAKHGYYAMVSEVDHQVGRLLAYLEEVGIAEETIVIYTSDHGEWLGEHLRYGKGYPAHDCISRTPLIINWPKRIRAGCQVAQMVEALDVIPTLLEAAAIPAPPHLQWRSFLPLLEGGAYQARESALTEGPGWKSLRLPGLRYVCEANGKESLFDLALDSAGYVDVAGDPAYAGRLSAARFQLLQHLLQAERWLPRSWAY
jgi:arylsulfatase A-like enzyme